MTGPVNARVPGKKTLGQLIRRDRQLMLMFLPIFLFYVVFCYLPMVGLAMAFEDFKMGSGFVGVFSSPWVGLRWFEQCFGSVFAWRLIRNTFLLSFYSLIFGFPIPIIFAICITQLRAKRFAKAAQVITYLPYFISTVVVVGMMNSMFNSSGIVHQIIASMGMEKINFLNDAQYFRPMYIGSNIWQSVGWDTIIFLSALSGLDMQLYEAAKIDGAGRWKQTLHVTIPGILPTIIIMLILAMGRIMHVSYQKILLMMTGTNQSVSDVISTYVYRRGITKADFSYATAVNLFQSLVSLLFVSVTNWISRRTSETSLW